MLSWWGCWCGGAGVSAFFPAKLPARSALAQVLIRQLDERVVAILRQLLTAAARQGSVVQQRLAELRRQTPAPGRELAADVLIREGRDER